MEKSDIKKLGITKKIVFVFSFLFVFLFASLGKVNGAHTTVSSVSASPEYISAQITGYYSIPDGTTLHENFPYATFSTDPTFPGGGTPTPVGTLSVTATGKSFSINITGLASGQTYYYRVQDFDSVYYTGQFTTLETDLSIGDSVSAEDSGSGFIYIKGTFNKGPATELPGENNFIYAVYGTEDGVFAYSTGAASTSPITGYDFETTGNFTISIPTGSLTAGIPYYYNLKDHSKTYYSVDPETGKTPFFEVDPDNVPTTLTTTSLPSAGCDGEFGYCLLAPLPGLERIEPGVDFGKYVNTILGVIIGVAGAVAVVMFVVAGIQYMASDVITSKGAAKKMMTDTIAGLLLLLGAFILLRTINPNLVDFKFALKDVTIDISQEELEMHSDVSSGKTSGKACANWDYEVGDTWFADTATRNTLTSSGFSINKSNCSKVGKYVEGGDDCTSVYNLNTTGINKLKSVCPDCEIVITAGTECWLHSYTTVHGPGNQTVDLRNNDSVPKLNAYVKKEGNYKGTISGWGKLYVTSDGIEFVDEGDHYHVWGWNGENSSKY